MFNPYLIRQSFEGCCCEFGIVIFVERVASILKFPVTVSIDGHYSYRFVLQKSFTLDFLKVLRQSDKDLTIKNCILFKFAFTKQANSLSLVKI